MTERVAFIIKKLDQLVEDNAKTDILLANAQLLVSELQQLQDSNKPSSIAVTIPKRNFVFEETHNEEDVILDVSTPTAIQEEEALPEPVELIIENEEKPIKTYFQQTYLFNIEEQEPLEPFRTKEEPVLLKQAEEPTLELNQRLAQEQTAINDKFKGSNAEVAHLHDNSHIKDLKRAISINEKYLFINNLFGRNEELYDKSIKHIQSFSILAEATFWIQKELKTKLGWSDEDEVVQLFDQFVSRRFS